MGNYISCTLSTNSPHSSSTKVILANGKSINVSNRNGSHAAAEFMLDYPGHFLVNSASLHVGHRFNPLTADEELEIGHVYVMFPMERINSVVGTADMGRLLVLAGKTARLARVAPAATSVALPSDPALEEPRWKLEELDSDLVAEVRGRMSVSRSRRPMLETIEEETDCSR